MRQEYFAVTARPPSLVQPVSFCSALGPLGSTDGKGKPEGLGAEHTNTFHKPVSQLFWLLNCCANHPPEQQRKAVQVRARLTSPAPTHFGFSVAAPGTAEQWRRARRSRQRSALPVLSS